MNVVRHHKLSQTEVWALLVVMICSCNRGLACDSSLSIPWFSLCCPTPASLALRVSPLDYLESCPALTLDMMGSYHGWLSGKQSRHCLRYIPITLSQNHQEHTKIQRLMLWLCHPGILRQVTDCYSHYPVWELSHKITESGITDWLLFSCGCNKGGLPKLFILFKSWLCF